MGGRLSISPFVLLALALALAGCRLDARVEVEVDRDGAGRLGVALTADAELLARAADAGVDPLADLAAAGEELSERGWRVRTAEEADGSRSVVLAGPFADPAELGTLSRQLAAALAGPEVDPLQPLGLDLVDDRLELSGRAGLEFTSATEELGLLAEDVVRILREQDALRYSVQATFPAEVLDADGGTVNGTTVTWNIRPGETTAFHAVATRPPPPLLPRLLAAAAALLLLLIGAVVLRRRPR